MALGQSISIAKVLSERSGQAIDANREFTGQGLANVVGGFFSSYVACGSLNRSLPNLEAGARTPLAAVFSSGGLLANRSAEVDPWNFAPRFHVPVRNILGMTECAGLVAIEPAASPRVPGSVGLRLPFTQVRVVPWRDGAACLGEDCAAGETGMDTFTYTMRDSALAQSTTTLTITIAGSNDAPVITAGGGDTGAVAEPVGTPGATPTAVNGSFAFTDADLNDSPGSGTPGTATLTAALQATSGAGITAAQQTQLDSLRSRVRAELARECEAGTVPPWPCDDVVADEAVEIELMRRRSSLGGEQ